jgi:hypothetical protein
VEEAVPRQNAVKAPAEIDFAHVGDDPLPFREARAAAFDHRRRSIHADYFNTALNEVARERLAHAAPEVEHRAFGTYATKESIQPRALLKRAAAVTVVRLSVSLV